MSFNLAKRLIQENIKLPTLPRVVAKINALIDDPAVGVREIGSAVAEDAPTAARVLKIANSAYFGLRERVLTTEHATAVLGMRMLRTVAMQASVISRFEYLESSNDFDLEALWKHAILTGQVCSAIVKRSRTKLGISPDEAHVIGLLHDIGKVLMLEAMPEPFLAAMRAARAGEGPEHACEERAMGFDHAQVGAMVASYWGLPRTVPDAIQHHHDLREALARNGTPALVALANLLVHEVEQQDPVAAEAAIDESAQVKLGIGQDDVAQVVQFATRTLSLIEV
jgi:putative nucleotidyltransferase with HDIG domain